MLRTRMILGAAATMTLTLSAAADLIDVRCQQYLHPDWVANGYDTDVLLTYRVHAIFDHPGDQLLAVFGTTADPIVIDSSNDAIENAASFDSQTAPLDLTGIGIWLNQWDSYVTVDTTNATGDDTSLSPGFVWQVDTDWNSTGDSWFVTPASPQGIAGADGRVLIAQFTLEAGESLSGSVNIQAQLASGVFEQYLGMTFSCSPCRGDVNGDGVVNVADILALFANWGPCAGCPEDIDGNGIVGIGDLLIVLDEFGMSGC